MTKPDRSMLAVLFLVLLAYLQIFNFEFVNRDDPFFITQNPLISGEWQISELWKFLFTPNLFYPIPIPVFIHKVLYEIFGLLPGIFHAVNLIVHLLSVRLILLIARRLNFSEPAAVAAALLFGIHPVTAESVCWATNLKTLLCGFFSLVIFYEISAPNFVLNSKQAFRLIVFSFLAILSKPTGVFLIAAVPTLLFSKGVKPDQIFKKYLTAVLPLAIFASICTYFFHERQNIPQLIFDWSMHLRGVEFAFFFQWGLLFHLIEAFAMHCLPLRPPPFNAMVDLFSPLIFIGLTIYSFSRSVRSWAGPLLLWSIFSLLPNIGIVPLPRYLADTYSYLPLAGFALIFGSFIDFIRQVAPFEIKPIILKVAALSLIFTLVMETWNASVIWKNNHALWAAAEEKFPFHPVVCSANAANFILADQPLEYFARLKECQRKHPDFHFSFRMAYWLSAIQHHTEAIELMTEFLKQHPENSYGKIFWEYLEGGFPPRFDIFSFETEANGGNRMLEKSGGRWTQVP